MPESSNKSGRKPRVTDEDLLDVFRSTSDPVLSTAEVADAVPIKRRGTLNRLQALEEDGELESKQIGGRNTVWWTEEDMPGSDRTSPDNTTNDTEREEQLKDIGIKPPRDEYVQKAVLCAFNLIKDKKRVNTETLKETLWEEYGDGHYDSLDSMLTSIDRHLKKSPHIKSDYGERKYIAEP